MTLYELRARSARRRALARLCVVCVAALALTVLIFVGPSDVVVAGGAR